MAERKRSKDGTRETDAYLDTPEMPSQSGRAEGELERSVGTRDEKKRAERGGGATRVRKSDEKGSSARPVTPGAAAPARRSKMTDLTEGTWVLVADGEKALFLKNLTDAENPHLAVVTKEEQENPRTGEQGANRPGRMGDTGAGQRSAMEDTDWHQLAKDRFADEAAAMLYDMAHRKLFERIVLVAAPHVLGEIRDKLHKEVAERVVGEIPKTLTNHPVDRIERIVADELAAD